MSLSEATDATPRQMVAFIEAAGPTRLAITAAWHSEMFARQKKLKPLQQVLGETFVSSAPAGRLSGKERAAFARMNYERAEQQAKDKAKRGNP